MEIIERREPSIDDFDSDERILFRDSSYLIIDKPCDVRMDGDYEVTVDKLVRRWIPYLSPSSELKWCHQLDYATSGVLCMAFDKESASEACGLFARKKAEKVYAALLYGHIDLDAIDEIDASEAPNFDESLKRKKTKLQFKPAYSFFDQHQTLLRNKHKRLKLDSKDETKVESFINQSSGSDKNHNDELGDDGSNDIFCDIDDVDEETLLSMKWKDVKQIKELAGKYKLLAEQHQKREAIKQQKKESEIHHNAYKVYKIKGENGNSNKPIGDGSVSSSSQQRTVFYVQCPIGEVPNEFHMKVDPAGKPSITKVEMVKQAYWNSGTIKTTKSSKNVVNSGGDDSNVGGGSSGGENSLKDQSSSVEQHEVIPVTEVRLFPKTGRRHQLRVHMAHIGHPIVGDCTYANKILPVAPLSADPLSSTGVVNSTMQSTTIKGIHEKSDDASKQPSFTVDSSQQHESKDGLVHSTNNQASQEVRMMLHAAELKLNFTHREPIHVVSKVPFAL